MKYKLALDAGEAFPLQINSKDAHIQGWGCYLSSYAKIVCKALGVTLTEEGLRALFLVAVALGFVQDNEKAVGSPGWNRAWVKDRLAWMRLVAARHGAAIEIEEVGDGSISATPEGCYTMIAFATNKTDGRHACAGTVSSDLVATVEYDPWPGLARLDVAATRHFRIKVILREGK